MMKEKLAVPAFDSRKAEALLERQWQCLQLSSTFRSTVGTLSLNLFVCQYDKNTTHNPSLQDERTYILVLII